MPKTKSDGSFFFTRICLLKQPWISIATWRKLRCDWNSTTHQRGKFAKCLKQIDLKHLLPVKCSLCPAPIVTKFLPRSVADEALLWEFSKFKPASHFDLIFVWCTVYAHVCNFYLETMKVGFWVGINYKKFTNYSS